MKKLLFILSLSFSSVLFAQERNGITYQALIVDPSGEFLPGADNNYSPLKNTSVCLQFHIIDSTNSYEYSEQHTVTTDNFGMVNLVIGTGSAIGGVGWENVSWSASAKSLKVDVDKTGSCSSFEELSNQPLTSVPFALYSPGSDTPGPQGDPGEEGMSAYEVWLDLGNTGTEQDFIDSLKGPEGDPGDPGTDGDSAYDVWIEAGNTGTEQEFLDSLKATDGNDGNSAYDIWLSAGNTGTEQDFLDSLMGNDGDSAYDIWLSAGNTGTEQEFLDSLKGENAETNSFSGGLQDFGCYNVISVFEDDSSFSINSRFEDNGIDNSILTFSKDNLSSKHVRINFSLNIDNGSRSIEITALDENDNRIICFFDVNFNKVFFDSKDYASGKSYSGDRSRNGVMFYDEIRSNNGDYSDTTNYMYSVDLYSHSVDISKILFVTQNVSSTAAFVNFTNLQIFEFKCETPQFTQDYSVSETIVDFNGENLVLVQLGEQRWSQSNLNVTAYSDGTPIPQFDGTDEEWKSLTTGAWRYYNDDPSYNYLGKIYNSYAVQGVHDNDATTPNKKLAPNGYKIPTKADLEELTSFLISNGFNSDGSFIGSLDYGKNFLSKSLSTTSDLWSGFGGNPLFPNDNIQANNESKLNFQPYYYQNSWITGHSAYYWLFSENNKKLIYGIYKNNKALNLIDVTTSTQERGCFVRIIKE